MNDFKFKLSKTFNKSFSRLEKNVKKQMEKTISNFMLDINRVDFIKLKGHESLYRIRSGDYRILFEKYDSKLLIVFFDVKHRKEVYRDL